MDDEVEMLVRTSAKALGALPAPAQAILPAKQAWSVVEELGWFHAGADATSGGLELPFAALAALAELAGSLAFPGPVIEALALSTALPPEEAGRSTLGWVQHDSSQVVAQVNESTSGAYLLSLHPDDLWTGSLEVLDGPSGDPGARLASAARAERAPGSAEPLLYRALVLSAAYELGMASAALQLAVEHAKVRTQFGQPIGAFQAVQQHVGQMHVWTTEVRALVDRAVAAEDDGTPVLSLAAASRAYAARAGRRVVEDAIQVHGGIGFTAEVPLHLYLKRADTFDLVLGSPDALAELVGRIRTGQTGTLG